MLSLTSKLIQDWDTKNLHFWVRYAWTAEQFDILSFNLVDTPPSWADENICDRDLYSHGHSDGLVQGCSNSIANALELLQSCTKPLIWACVPSILPKLFMAAVQVQSSAVITRSNIVRYCINDCRNSGRISLRWWIPKKHPILRPNGRAMGCL